MLVSGEPGIGKTRLLDELESLARARKIRVLRGRSVEQDRAFAYHGFCEVIQDYFLRRDTASAAPDISDLAPELVALFPTLGEITDLRSAVRSEPAAAEPAPPRVPEDRTHVFELLARTLARLGGGKELLLFFEDLHGAEVSIEALQYVARRLAPTPTLIVGTYRSSEIGALHPLMRLLEAFRGDRRFIHLQLGPLSPSEHRSLVETLVGSREVSEELAARLYEGSEGNPFFGRELVRSLLDSGAIGSPLARPGCPLTGPADGNAFYRSGHRRTVPGPTVSSVAQTVC